MQVGGKEQGQLNEVGGGACEGAPLSSTAGSKGPASSEQQNLTETPSSWRF